MSPDRLAEIRERDLRLQHALRGVSDPVMQKAEEDRRYLLEVVGALQEQVNLMARRAVPFSYDEPVVLCNAPDAENAMIIGPDKNHWANDREREEVIHQTLVAKNRQFAKDERTRKHIRQTEIL